MEFRECVVCGDIGVVFDMQRVEHGRWRHKNCEMTYNPPVEARVEETRKVTWQAPTIGNGWKQPTAPQESVAFDRPEDGSQKRYVDRRAKRPWAAHTAWWFVHNVISHPLIGVLPVAPAFRFHDWTSRKMHGV